MSQRRIVDPTTAPKCLVDLPERLVTARRQPGANRLADGGQAVPRADAETEAMLKRVRITRGIVAVADRSAGSSGRWGC